MFKITRALMPALLVAAVFGGEALAFNPQPDPPAKFKLLAGERTLVQQTLPALPPNPCKTVCTTTQLPPNPCRVGIACAAGH